MIIPLTGTTSAKISAELLRARSSAGSPAQGMVLTLIIVCDESEYASAMEASMAAGREHPSRILLVVTAAGRSAGLDAEVHLGEGTPGEVVVIRMRGAVAAHPASVIRPLLLPDSPVVIWWPGKAPNNQATDELARLAMRRLTDAAASARPLAMLRARARDYTPGDTDLSWTRLTPWRALLAAALDQYPAKIKSVLIEAESSNPSADLLAAWLGSRLNLDVTRKISKGPGLTAVRMTTAAGDIAITRPDGLLAYYAVPGQPERLVALKRRDYTELISEELRRMDADDVYERAVKSLLDGAQRAGSTRSAAKKASSKRTVSKRTAGKQAAGSKTAVKKAASKRTAAKQAAGSR
ncbi:MAG TPA: glucose-6-phosphate dehydrogenase assembly protein OpcA [Propionibacteriaceae bacterium]|nr:glucose-6-phosphate dehydrogenase assembly protein OpcA [Propionibacteriaceae bacterium]